MNRRYEWLPGRSGFVKLSGSRFGGGEGLKQMVAPGLEFLAGQPQAINNHIVYQRVLCSRVYPAEDLKNRRPLGHSICVMAVKLKME